MNLLGFQFNATECNGWPKLKFFIDDDLYHDYEFSASSGIVELPLDLLSGPHEIKIEFYGKTQHNTILADNEIVEDQLVTLELITVDHVTIPDFIKYLGVYQVDDVKRSQILTWGQNGFWTLQIEYPIIDWILNLKMQTIPSYTDNKQWTTSVFHPKKIQSLRDNLTVLEKLLSNVDT